MRRFHFVLVAFAAAAVALAVEAATIADILKDADKFHKKTVTVKGTATGFQQKTSQLGNQYYKFKLAGSEEGKTLTVYGRGNLVKGPEEGAKVQVTGIYFKEKKVGTVTFKNEIDVTKNPEDEKQKDFGIKVIQK